MLPFKDNATVAKLEGELLSLAGEWERLKTSVMEKYAINQTTKGPYDAEEVEIVYKNSSSCNNSPFCCYRVLRQYLLMHRAS